MQRLTIVLIAAGFSLLVLAACAASDDTPSFTLSSNSNDIILKLTSPGGGYREAGVSGDTTLYGDGRFVSTSRQNNRVKTKEVSLSHTQMRDLVGILVEGNLLNWLDEEMTHRFEEQMGGVPQHENFGGMVIHVSLETYGDTGPLIKNITYSINRDLLQLTHPDKPVLSEILAFETFREQVKSYFQTKIGDNE